MKPIVCLLFLYNVILSSAEENATESSTTEGKNANAEDMEGRESRESNISLTLVLANLEEALPAPEPLVGTFPHDFDLSLPNLSRRSYDQEVRGQGHSFEEQGAVSTMLCHQSLIPLITQNCPRVTASGAGAAWRGRRRTGPRRPSRRSTAPPLGPPSPPPTASPRRPGTPPGRRRPSPRPSSITQHISQVFLFLKYRVLSLEFLLVHTYLKGAAQGAQGRAFAEAAFSAKVGMS